MSDIPPKSDRQIIEWLEARLADAEFEVLSLKQRLSESNAMRKECEKQLQNLLANNAAPMANQKHVDE